jgi:hypothetical protein
MVCLLHRNKSSKRCRVNASRAAVLSICERNTAEVDRLASELIELSTRHNFVYWLAIGTILRGWARSASGDTAKGIPAIEDGIGVCRIGGEMLDMPLLLALKAESLHLADRTSEALEAIAEAEAVIERSGAFRAGGGIRNVLSGAYRN